MRRFDLKPSFTAHCGYTYLSASLRHQKSLCIVAWSSAPAEAVHIMLLPMKESPRCTERNEGLLPRPAMAIRVAIPNGDPLIGDRNQVLEMVIQCVLGFLQINDHSNTMLIVRVRTHQRSK